MSDEYQYVPEFRYDDDHNFYLGENKIGRAQYAGDDHMGLMVNFGNEVVRPIMEKKSIQFREQADEMVAKMTAAHEEALRIVVADHEEELRRLKDLLSKCEDDRDEWAI